METTSLLFFFILVIMSVNSYMSYKVVSPNTNLYLPILSKLRFFLRTVTCRWRKSHVKGSTEYRTSSIVKQGLPFHETKSLHRRRSSSFMRDVPPEMAFIILLVVFTQRFFPTNLLALLFRIMADLNFKAHSAIWLANVAVCFLSYASSINMGFCFVLKAVYRRRWVMRRATRF